MYKKLIVIFLSCLCWSGVSQASDIVKLIEKKISKDRKSLDLTGLNIGPKGAKQLAKIKSLSSLVTLHLQGNRIKARGMKALAKSPHFANLKHFM